MTGRRPPSRTALANLAAAAVLAGLAALLPVWTGPSYTVRIGFLTLVYVVLSLAWNLLGGLAGQVSFGFSAFFGLGAYAAAIALRAGQAFPVGLIAGILVAAAFSLLIGYPTLRLRGPYFAIATIGISEAVRVVMLNWESVTGGASGLNIPVAAGTDPVLQYYQALALALGALALSWYVMSSPFGLALVAVKDDEDAARALGVDALRAKLIVHALAAVLVAAAGAMYARLVYFVQPNGVFAFELSVAILLMPVIGGLGTLWGPVVGGVIYGVVREQIAVEYPQFQLLLYGALLILIVIFEPGGLAGLARRAARALGRAGGAAAGSRPAAGAVR